MKIVVKSIKLEMGNLEHNVDLGEDENKVHMKKKEH